jgi:hypothetical protein
MTTLTAQQLAFFAKATGTIDELVATELLPLSRNSHYDAVRGGDVPAIRLNKRWVVLTGKLREKLCLSLPEASA